MREQPCHVLPFLHFQLHLTFRTKEFEHVRVFNSRPYSFLREKVLAVLGQQLQEDDKYSSRDGFTCSVVMSTIIADLRSYEGER